MCQLPGNKVASNIRQPVLTLLIDEGILTRGKGNYLLMSMQSGAIDTIQGFGQKSCIEAMLGSNGLENVFGRHKSIGNGEGIAGLEIEFMLTGCYLVMAGLDVDVHLLERLYHLPAYSGCKIRR